MPIVAETTRRINTDTETADHIHFCILTTDDWAKATQIMQMRATNGGREQMDRNSRSPPAFCKCPTVQAVLTHAATLRIRRIPRTIRVRKRSSGNGAKPRHAAEEPSYTPFKKLAAHPCHP
mmetsp:Transcript_39215/g.118534  ORF Transcript_39215/g.118534 Transcript_39215/m.118534 type:complete len:121 (+) Transcript_39215:110-472(+)